MRDVDNSIVNLRRQVDGLARVLETLRESLASQRIYDRAAEKRQLWGAVESSLRDCYPTVIELNEKLRAVVGHGGTNGFFRQVGRTLKLNLHQEDIDKLLAEMQTHSINLQLALAIVQLMLAASTPETVVHELSSRFERLERMMLVVDERLAIQSYPLPTARPVDNTLDGVKLDSNTKSLRQSASTVITSASTAAGRSVSGITHRSVLPSSAPAFEHLDPLKSDHLPAIEESTTGSELGIPIPTSTRTQIQSWIQASSTELTQVPEVSDSRESTASPSETLTSTFSGVSVGSDTQGGEPALEIFDENSDDDDALEVQLIQNYFSRAKASINTENYQVAMELIRRGLDESRFVGPTMRLKLKLGDMQLQFAVCCFHRGKIDDAEEMFMALTREQVKDVDDALRVLNALHGLAMLNLRKRNLEAASTHCRQALQGRRRTKTIGKQHPDYFASLRLSALISWAKDDKIKAEAYSQMLPEGQRLDPEDFDRILETEFGISPSDVSAMQSSGGVLSPVSTQGSDTLLTPSESVDLGRNQSPRASPQIVKQRKIGAIHVSTEELRSDTSPPPTAPMAVSEPMRQAAAESPGARRPNSISRKITPLDHFQASMLPTKEKALIAAIEADNVGLVDSICKGFGKANVNVKDPHGQTPLMLAANQGSVSVCDVLLFHGAWVNAQDKQGTSALMSAASNGTEDVCAILVKQKALLDLTNNKGCTALMHAAINGRLSACRYLLQCGALVDIKDGEGKDVLELAKDHLVKSLLRKFISGRRHQSEDSTKAQPSEQPSLVSDEASEPKDDEKLLIVSAEDTATAKTLVDTRFCSIFRGKILLYEAIHHAIDSDNFALAECVSTNFKIEIERKGARSTTGAKLRGLLHTAVQKDRRNICRLLLKNGAPVNELNSRDQTPLNVAATHGREDLARLLLDHGASVNAMNSNTLPPLNIAAIHGQDGLAKILLDHGALKDGVDGGQPPLLHAAATKNHAMCRLLLAEGADPNARSGSQLRALLRSAGIGNEEVLSIERVGGSYRRCTALHIAVSADHDVKQMELCKTLLDAGADPDLATEHGKTPLMFATWLNLLVPVELLLSKGASLNLKDSWGGTALHEASKINGDHSLQLCKLLVAHGADPSIKNTAGETALDRADSKDKKTYFKSLQH